jgi:phosphoglycolate phosphatase
LVAEPIYLDLDGTLVDSVPGIEVSLAHALAAAGVPARVADWRPFIGPPVRQVVAAALPDLEGATLDRIVGHFRDHYDAQGCEASVPWDGVSETLRDLHDRGHPLYIVTNKPALPTGRIVAFNGWSDLFRAVVAGDRPYAPSPGQAFTKADRTARLVAEQRLTGGLFVGDGVDDAEAADRVGARFLLAGWGYGVEKVRRSHPGARELTRFPDLVSALSGADRPPRGLE